ncbi:hypothetical protein BG57_23705 [Caballeronia grimmiae]|uniref:Uncharacterized protein n=1 Tax=Caballeronia grimmiae TaxID=1071679 RepID=A0A069NG23_9BURK|nr:hypothetical protein BG57_23705 [Caballeronia grimmiae]
MAWQMQDLEVPVTEIDNIPFLDDFRDGRRSHAVVRHLVIGTWKSGYQIAIKRIAPFVVSTNRGIAQYRSQKRAVLAWRAQVVGLEFVDKRVLELMMPANMIRVRMCRDCGYLLLQQMPGRVTQTGDAQSRIDQQVPVAAPHMPDIAPHQWYDMRFP